MKNYLYILNTIKTAFIYRVDIAFSSVGNILYLAMSYCLWSSIYGSNSLLVGDDFESTFVGICLSSTLITFYRTNTEWYFSEAVISGSISTDLIKPISLKSIYFFRGLGELIFNLVVIFCPVYIVLCIVYGNLISTPIQLAYFVVSFLCGYTINFLVNYQIGVISIFTHSVWGVSTVKDSVILLMSGAIIPLSYFGDTTRSVFENTPFYYVALLPIEVIKNSGVSFYFVLDALLVQIMWIIVMFLAILITEFIAFKKIVVNGG